jgi:drug/metabolite transporter (DMT)-like permease
MHGAFFSALQPARCLSLFGLKNLRRPGTGIAYIVLTAGCFATTDATVKHLGAALPVLVLLWSRYVFQTTAMAVMQATRRGWRDMFRSGHPRLQALRAALLLGNATCVFIGLQHLPLAEFTALAMLAPMASTLLASLVLRERVTPARWAMVVLGFIGMLMIVRPGNGDLGWAASFPLAGALFFAAFQIVTNRLSAVDDMVTTNFFSGLGALLLLCVALALMPLDVMPSLSHASASQWLLIGMVGALATLGQMCMVLAIRSAPLSTLTPFSYSFGTHRTSGPRQGWPSLGSAGPRRCGSMLAELRATKRSYRAAHTEDVQPSPLGGRCYLAAR